MKTTLDIPDTLYREFKAKTATNGEKMRNAESRLSSRTTPANGGAMATRRRRDRVRVGEV